MASSRAFPPASRGKVDDDLLGDEVGAQVDHDQRRRWRQPGRRTSSGTFRGCGLRAAADECEKITGARLTVMVSTSSRPRRATGPPPCPGGSSPRPQRRRRAHTVMRGVIGGGVGQAVVSQWSGSWTEPPARGAGAGRPATRRSRTSFDRDHRRDPARPVDTHDVIGGTARPRGRRGDARRAGARGRPARGPRERLPSTERGRDPDDHSCPRRAPSQPLEIGLHDRFKGAGVWKSNRSS